MKTRFCLAVTLALLMLPAAVVAQEDHSGHDMQATDAQPAAEGAAKAYMDGMAKMSRDMNAAMTGDADIDFAIMMIPHHQGAIDMARVQLQSGKDPDLRKLSEAVVAAQDGEIAFLKAWLDRHPAPAGGSDHAQHTPAGMAYMQGMAAMNKDMNAAMTGDADRDFAVMMIPHHRGAIAMAKVQLQHGKDAGLRALSNAIISAQEREIAFLTDWLARR